MPRKPKTTASNQRIRSTSKTAAEQPKEEPTTQKQSTLAQTQPVNWTRRASVALATLGTIYFVVWILIGLFVMFVIIQGIRLGQYSGLFGNAGQASDQSQQQSQNTNQTEVNLPGIGMVNVSCVQSALSADSLQKVIQSRSIDVLSPDEKTRFQACVTQPEASGSAAPSESPAGS